MRKVTGPKIVLLSLMLCSVIFITSAKLENQPKFGAYIPDEFANITDLSDPVILECWQPFFRPKNCLQDLLDIYYKRVDWKVSPVGPKCCQALSTLPCKKPLFGDLDSKANPLIPLHLACAYHGYNPKVHLGNVHYAPPPSNGDHE